MTSHRTAGNREKTSDRLRFRHALDESGNPVRVVIVQARLDPNAPDKHAEQRLIDVYRAGRQDFLRFSPELLRRNRAMKGQPRRSDRELAVVAECYARLNTEGIRPLKPAVKRELDDRKLNIELSGLDKQLKAARDRGLLTCPGQGRTGGELTDKARELLAAGD